MSHIRYVVEYIPRTAVEAVERKHKRAIERGMWVWDYVEPDSLTKSSDWADEKTAFGVAKRVEKLDEFGEVHVFEQVEQTERDDSGSWQEWHITRRAVFYAGDTEFKWETWT